MSMLAPSLRGRVSRRDVALSPHVWFAVWASFALFAVSTLIIAFAMPGISGSRMLLLSGVLAVVAAALSRTRAPEPGSPASHAILSLVYLGPALTMWAFAPHASGVIVSAVFVAPLVSIWIPERRQILAHLVAASLVLLLPSLLGAVDRATLFSCLATIPAIWVLAGCCVLVMESAETQGRVLERMVGIDPLTGLGNRRSLDDQLANELTRHSAAHRQLTILALDLDGLGHVNDKLGRTVGDELLERVAKTLTRAARHQDIVVRLRGDEFCVLLPSTGPQEAATRVRVLREHLSQIAEFGSGVTAGFGAATYPDDATTKADLLRVADERLQNDKRTARAHLPSPVSLAAELASRVDGGDLPARRRAASAPPETLFDDRITRRELSLNRTIWALVGGVTLLFVLLGAAMLATAPELTTPAFPYVLAFAAAMAMFTLITPPPAAGTLASHVAVLVTSLVPTLALACCQPGGSLAIGTAVFVGAIAAMRSPDRKTLVLHLLAAQAMLFSLIPLGLVDTITAIGILLLICVLWVVSACYLLVLEAIEAQGAELAALGRHDPLTGVGNRRMLHEQLGRAIPAHEAASRPLTIVALDIAGFGAVNERLGHAAGDDLLITVARRLSEAAGPEATVTRQGGDEFCVLLPDTSSYDAETAIAALRRAVESIELPGLRIGAEIGAATYPFDGTDTVTLLERADAELLHEKFRVLDLSAPLSA